MAFRQWTILGALCCTVTLAESPRRIPDLVTQLDSPKFAERDQAEKQLRAYGPEALPELKDAFAKAKSKEARKRLKRLINEMIAAQKLAPTLIALKAGKRPLSKIISEISRQSGHKIGSAELKQNPLLRFEKMQMPFWEALDFLGRKAGFRPQVSFKQNALTLVPSESKKPFTVLHRSFRLEVIRFHEDRDIDFLKPGPGPYQGKHSHRLTLKLSVMSEPGFTLLQVDPVQVESAVDENGLPFPVVKPDSSEWYPDRLSTYLHGKTVNAAQLFLQRSSDKARKIARLTGTVPVFVVVKKTRVVMTKDFLSSKGTTLKLPEGELKILAAREDGFVAGYDLQIQIPEPLPGVDLQWHDRVRLEDANGNPYPGLFMKCWDCQLHSHIS